MSLTTTQLQALKTDILANAGTFDGKTPAEWWAEKNPGKIAAFYNQVASPDYLVWRTSLPFSEVMDNLIDVDWQQMDNLTTGQARIWENLQFVGTLKPATTAHRAAITECWKGTAAKVAVATRIFGLGKRKATILEKLLTVSGDGTSVTPGTMGFEGSVGWEQVNAAMES